MAVYDDIIFSVVKEADAYLTDKLNADVLFYNGPISMNCFLWLREIVEKMTTNENKKSAIAVFLTTPGGQAETAEKFVDVLRHKYDEVYFVVPVAAMSAGTILCMAGDKIYMDYSSSLGPIDPQVPDREGRGLIPALGHLDKVNELLSKAASNNINPVEYGWLMEQDLGVLRLFEEARNLSIDFLKTWLVKYKFRNWMQHRTNNPGTSVTLQEKEARAEEIAKLLSNNAHWHSHGRMIGLNVLREACRLEIDDYGDDEELQKQIRRYNDALSDYMSRIGITNYIYAVNAT